MNVEPFPGSLEKAIDPLSSSMNFFVILNPNPYLQISGNILR